jgi:predicted nucleotidyltransferase
VSESAPLLGREGIEEAFRRLGDRLAKRGVVADIYVFGGAAMALAYDSRRATRDVDALFKPHGIVLEEAQVVAAELGLPKWWLNEQASSYVAPGGDPSASRVFDHPGLRVFAASCLRRFVSSPLRRFAASPLRRFAASPEHLLAMKALAARPRDAQDIRQLAEVLDLHTIADVLALVRDVFPEEEPPARLRLLLEDIFTQSN